jgi:transposase-like protein
MKKKEACIGGEEVFWINRRTGSYRCLRCGFQYNVREHGSPVRHLLKCGVAGKDDAMEGVIDALKIVASGNTDPDRMVEIAQKALAKLVKSRGF